MKFLLLSLSAVLAQFGGVAQAAFTASTYDDPASFFAAAGGGLTNEDFEDIGFLGSGQPFDPAHPGLASGVSFSGENLQYFDDTTYGIPFGYPQIQTVQLFSNSFSSSIQLDFDPLLTALGFSVVSWPAGSIMRVEVLDGLGDMHTFNPDATNTNPAYFGIVVSAGSIQRATLFTGATTVGLDNLSFGQARAVPEPGTLALLALGLVGLGLSRRRKG